MIDTKRQEFKQWTSTKHKRPLKLRKFGEPFWEAEAAVNNFTENVGLCSIDPFTWDEDDVCKWFYALIDGDLPEDFDVERYTPQKLSGMSREEWAELPNGRVLKRCFRLHQLVAESWREEKEHLDKLLEKKLNGLTMEKKDVDLSTQESKDLMDLNGRENASAIRPSTEFTPPNSNGALPANPPVLTVVIADPKSPLNVVVSTPPQTFSAPTLSNISEENAESKTAVVSATFDDPQESRTDEDRRETTNESEQSQFQTPKLRCDPLWKFVFNLLEDPDEYLPVVSWVDQEHGVWKIHNTTLLAKLWGEFTGNKQMTYATLAHSLRLYYGKILERTARNQRLQHRFKAGFLESKNKRAQGLFLPLSRPLPLLSDPKRQYTPL